MVETSNKNNGNPDPSLFGVAEFTRESGAALSRIEQGIIDADVDADPDFVSEGVLEIEFADGSKMIVNRHEVSREVWVAGRTGAYHFRWDGNGWFDTRTGDGLLAVVSRLASQISGQSVSIS